MNGLKKVLLALAIFASLLLCLQIVLLASFQTLFLVAITAITAGASGLNWFYYYVSD